MLSRLAQQARRSVATIAMDVGKSGSLHTLLNPKENVERRNNLFPLLWFILYYTPAVKIKVADSIAISNTWRCTDIVCPILQVVGAPHVEKKVNKKVVGTREKNLQNVEIQKLVCWLCTWHANVPTRRESADNTACTAQPCATHMIVETVISGQYRMHQ